MDVAYPTIDEPATPEYVLAVFQDLWIHGDGIVPEIALTFETSVDDWRYGHVEDFYFWKQIGWSLNEIWGLQCKDAEWRTVLVPGGEKRLIDVCEFIAQRTIRPRIREARLLGRPCLPGGGVLDDPIFRSRKLARMPDEIGPSTELAPFTRSL